MNKLKEILICIAIIIICFAVFLGVTKHHHSEINDLAKQNKCQVVSIESCVFDKGPYWLAGEDDSVYYVIVTDEYERQRAMWVHFGIFGIEHEWKR